MTMNRLVTEESDQGFLTTYADLMTLLLVFFVLLFSMSSLEKVEFSNMARAFQKALGDDGGSIIPLPEELKAPTITPPDTLETENPSEMVPSDLIVSEPEKPIAPELPENSDLQDQMYISNSLKDVFASMGVQDDLTVTDPKDGKIRIKVNGSVAFESGDTAFKRGMMPIMDSVIEILEKYPEYHVDIQGHTDNVPINTPQFPTNWELSAVRATTVLRYFMRGGIQPARVTATGYGDSMPLASNSTLDGQAENRRIEFVLEKVEEP